MLAAGTMMSNRVHDGADAKPKVGSGKKRMTTNDRAAREILLRMFSLEHKAGLQGWWLKILLLNEQNTRVTRLAYTVELYAVLAGLLLFFVADFVDVDPDGALGKISSILAIVSAMNFLCVIFICLALGHALVTTTSPAGIVLLLQPIGQTFVQIVFGGFFAFFAFVFKMADQTEGVILYVAVTMGALVTPYVFFVAGMCVTSPNPLENQHQWLWYRANFEFLSMVAYARFGPEKPRAEEMLEEYLDEMPEDIRALMRGDPGAA